jgi:hypothetical protein
MEKSSDLSGFKWLELSGLKNDAAAFPSVQMNSQFPLLPLLVATAVSILLNPVPVRKTPSPSTAGSAINNADLINGFNVSKPVTVLDALSHPRMLDKTIADIKSFFKTHITTPEYTPKKTEMKLLEWKISYLYADGGEKIGDCLTNYWDACLHRDRYQRGPDLPAGLTEDHLLALSVLERVDKVVIEFINNQPMKSARHYRAAINMLQAMAERSDWANPPMIDANELKKLRKLSYFENFKSEIVTVQRTISPEQRYLNFLKRYKRNLISSEIPYMNFVAWLYKKSFLFNQRYGHLSGSMTNKAAKQLSRDHIYKITMTLIKKHLATGMGGWSSPFKAAEALHPEMTMELKLLPIPHEEGAKKPPRSMSMTTYAKVVTQLFEDHPEFVRASKS